MASEQYANDVPNNSVATTLNGAINNSVVSLTVAGFSGFPAAAQYRIRIEDELLIVTGGAGTTTWTVTRGAEGTTAASHASGATVTHLLTRDGLLGVGTRVLPSDTLANLPAAGQDGRVFLPTDAFTILRDDGSAWTTFGPLFKLVAPIDAQFAWINQGSATVTATTDAINLRSPGSTSAGNSANIRKKAAPGTPYIIDAYIIPTVVGKDTIRYGIGFRESSSGKLVLTELFFQTTGDTLLRVVTWSSPTAPVAALVSLKIVELPRWLRIEDNGTNRIYSYSQDGQYWVQLFSEARTTFLTADEIGFYAQSSNQATPAIDVSLTLLHWRQH